MTALASSSDFVSNSYDASAVTRAINWATSLIASYCNRNFDLVTGDTVTVSPIRGSAFLPQFPVVSVSSVYGYLPSTSGAGMAWTALTNYQYVASTGLIYDTTGLPGTQISVGPSWPWLPGSLRVTYDHGYASVPQDLTDVCVRLATQYLENPTMMVSRRVGDMEARFSGSSGGTVSKIDKIILDRYVNVGVS